MICMDPAVSYPKPRISIVTGKLTDQKIERYRRDGWYSEGFRQARREFQAKRKAKREGNFVSNEGRLIYSPL